MIKKIILLIALLALINSHLLQKSIQEYKDLGYQINHHSQGQHSVELGENLIHIINSNENIHESQELNQIIEEKYSHVSQSDLDQSITTCSKGKGPKFFNFLAWPLGTIGNSGKKSQTTLLEMPHESCYANVLVEFTLDSEDSFTLEISASGWRGGLTCSDVIQYSTGEAFYFPIILTIANKNKTIKVSNQTKAQMEGVQGWGIHFFQTCDKITNLIPDLYLSLKLFIGGLSDNPDGEGLYNSRPTEDQVQANIDFVLQNSGYQWQKRENPVLVDLDDTEVQSGDFIIITRFDGVDELVAYGAGGHAGHTCLLVEEPDGEMYVYESQDGWYWPVHGIQKNPWSQWKIWADNAGFNVAIVPLSDEKRKIFNKNIQAAYDFFDSVEGVPYGYHNFLFGWLDDVNKNIPPISTIDYFYVLFCQVEKMTPYTMTRFAGEALNKRLGTEGLTLPQVANTAAQRGMTLAELFGIPEQDDWVYSDGPSMVCSSFVTRMYKEAGLFEGVDIQATEFTPRDVYQLNFWNTNAKLPEKCTQNDPNLPYCQVMGDYVMDITQDLWNTVKPYDNMFENCPSEAPLYLRDTSYPYGC